MKNNGKGSRVKVPTGLEQPWVAKNDQVTVGQFCTLYKKMYVQLVQLPKL